MAKKNERTVLFLDLHIVTKTHSPNITGLPNRFSLDQLLNMVDGIREANNVNDLRGSEGNKKEIYLADIEHDVANKCWKLLINITDTTLADEVHRKIGGNEATRKVNSKTEGVGTDFSSHIIIKSEPEANGNWLALYEQSSALPVKLIASYLNNLLKRVSKANQNDFVIDHPHNKVDEKGNKKQIRTYCYCHFNGHLSTEFQNDLNNGSFNDISLISAQADSLNGYDAQKHTAIKELRLPLNIDKDAINKSGGNFKWIDYLRTNDAKDLDMEKIKISFKDDGNVAHTAEIDINTGNLMNNERYVKKVKVTDFTDILTTSVNLIHKPIITKMLEHL